MITRTTIDQVFETARVEEVIGDFVQLKKSGSNFKGLSPFTDERSPSFMVSPVKQIWKDFSSGKGGNAVTFLMEHEHFSYPEAIKYLAKKYNIEIEETEQTDEQKELANERESMYLVTEFASKYFQKTMNETDQGQAIGLSYFKERGFTAETIKSFGLGYSLDEWQAFTDEALKQGYKLEFLEKTGLTIVKEDATGATPQKRFDRFKGRVMFPIQSMSGRVLGFGGRILTNDKKAAKYVNSPESDIYHKSKVLYGIYHAKKSIAKENNCYLVEGYTDVIQFHQTGIENVVASSGTALTPDQIRLINRLTPNITVLFDGDAAGMRASIRGIDLILEQGMNVRVCTFPDGEDPDSFAKQNTLEELSTYLQDNAKDFIAFKASMLMDEAKNDPIKKADLIRDMVVSISKIPDRIKKEIYVQECAKIMDISESVLFSTLAQIDKKDLKEANKQFKQEQKAFEVIRQESRDFVDVIFQLEKSILAILLSFGQLEFEYEDEIIEENEEGFLNDVKEVNKYRIFEKIFLELQEDEVEFSNKSFLGIYNELINLFTTQSDINIDQIASKISSEYSETVSSIIMNEFKYDLSDWESKNIIVKDKIKGISQRVFQTLTNYRLYLVTELIENLKINKIGTEENKEVLQDIVSYNSLKTALSDRFGTNLNLGHYNFLQKN